MPIVQYCPARTFPFVRFTYFRAAAARISRWSSLPPPEPVGTPYIPLHPSQLNLSLFASHLYPQYLGRSVMRTISILLLLTAPVLSAINVLLQLQSTELLDPLTVTQTCTTLPPGQCCVPVDISELPPPRFRERYEVTLVRVRIIAPSTSHDVRIYSWAHSPSPCEGDVAAEFRLPSSGPGRVFRPNQWIRISGVIIHGSTETKPLYPSTISYKGGLYYEYLRGSLTYAKVSDQGDGPYTIYGMDQRLGV